MKFRTELTPTPYPFQIDHSDNMMFVGSCFSDHIGSAFERGGFQALSNPFGVLFNPVSITTALQLAIAPEQFDDRYIHHFNDQWISFAHHGRFAHPDKTFFLKQITQQFENTRSFLQKADYLFITLGTAYCYRHIERDLIVANCHKIPNYEFEKRRLDVDEVVQVLQMLSQNIFKLNPNLKLIFTVSPVRHLGDGFHENQLSKSILHLAIDKMADNQYIFYFPAYEIVNDDLRDYRFYAKDLCHPGEQAIEYVWEKVKEAFFTKKTLEKITEAEKERKGREHRQRGN